MRGDAPPTYAESTYDVSPRLLPVVATTMVPPLPRVIVAATVIPAPRTRSMSWASDDVVVTHCSAVAIEAAAAVVIPSSSSASSSASTAATALEILATFADFLGARLSATVERRRTDLRGATLDDFTLSAKPIGAGSNCVCWEARPSKAVGRVDASSSFALKRARLYSHNNVRRRFVRELATSSACAHPNVLSIYSVFSAPPHATDHPEALILAEVDAADAAAAGGGGSMDDPIVSPRSKVCRNAQYAVMELLRGGNLDEYCAAYADETRRSSMPPRQCLFVALQIFDALECLHATGVAHADLKADNVAFREKPRGKGREEWNEPGDVPLICLVDFGEATPPTSAGPGGGVMQSASFSGSRATMPPEMFSSTARDNETVQNSGSDATTTTTTRLFDWRAADVWAVGLVLYALSGATVPPFQDEAVESGDVPPMPRLPQEYADLDRIARACLVPEPTMRPSARRAARLCASALWDLPEDAIATAALSAGEGEEGEGEGDAGAAAAAAATAAAAAAAAVAAEQVAAREAMAERLVAHFHEAGFWDDMVEAHAGGITSPLWDFVACGGDEVRLQLRYLRSGDA